MRSHRLRAAAGGGSTVEDLKTELQTVGDAIRAGRANYNHTHHYPSISHWNINYDGNDFYISDGNGDMYDSGNYTYVITNNWTSTSWSGGMGSLHGSDANTYNDTTVISPRGNYNHNYYYKIVAGGYGTTSNPTANLDHDTAGTLIMAATAGNWNNSSSSMKLGFAHKGNLGADGSGTTSDRTLYNGSTVNGFTVYAYDISTYNAGDPVVCNLYMFVGHPKWGTQFGTINNYFNTYTDENARGYWMTGVQNNVLAITALIAADTSSNAHNRHSDSMLTPIVDDILLDIKNEFGY